YAFQYKSNLLDAQWTTLSNYTPAGASLSVTDGPIADTQRFYQLYLPQRVSDVAGFTRLSLLGNSHNFVSEPCTRPPGVHSAIEPYRTLATAFPNGDGVIASPTPGNRFTELLMPDLTGSGVNLSATKVYYFNAGYWKQVGQGTINHNDDLLPLNTHFIVRHNV